MGGVSLIYTHLYDFLQYCLSPMEDASDFQFDVQYTPASPHPQSGRIVELLERPELLEHLAVHELKDLLSSEYGQWARILTPGRLCGDVCVGWAGCDQKTGAALISNDRCAVWLMVGYDGAYALRILAEDDRHPTREEEETVTRLLCREDGSDIDWTERSPNFNLFIDRVRARQEVRREHPIGEWIARIRNKIRKLF